MSAITIDPALKALIPPLSTEERDLLEASILEHGCRDPLVVWPLPTREEDGIVLNWDDAEFDHVIGEGQSTRYWDVGDGGGYLYEDDWPVLLLDGHNRFEICEKHGIGYDTVQLEFDSIEQARIWMRDNQMGRRNLSTAWRIDLQLANKEDLAAIGKARQSEAIQARDEKGRAAPVLSQNDKTGSQQKHNTQAEIAKAANTSTGMVGMAEVVRKKAPELWEKAKADEVTVSAAYKKIKKQDEIRQRAESVKAQTVEQSKALPAVIHRADALDWLQKVEPFDLLLTDPPYSTDVADIYQFSEWLPAALDKLKPTGRAFVFVGAYPKELQAYMDLAIPDQILVWTYRNTLGPSPKHDYKLNWQAILYYRNPEAPPLDCPVMLEQFSVQDINAPDGRLGDRYHSWQKPMDIAERFIRHSTKPGEVVADPFACTGTFLLAASKLGRQGIGCEIDQEHLEIAISRGCSRG